MSSPRNSGELAIPGENRSDTRVLVDAEPLEELLTEAADAGPRQLLTVATRTVTRLLGERGSCILLEGQPRVVLALHRPSLSDLPVALARYPEVTAAAETRRPVIVDDVWQDALLASVRELLPADLRAVAAVPLVVRDRCLGVILVQSARVRHTDDESRETAALLARLTALMLARQLDADGVPTPAPELVTSPVEIDAQALKGSRILIVEDDAATAEAVAETLTEEGFRVERAADGADCLRQVLDTAPDLILLDVNMPGMSGIDTATRLRAASATRRVPIPILFLSGLDDLPTRVRDMRFEQIDFMPKPFSIDELLVRIQQALRQGRTRQSLQLAADHDELTGLGNLRLLHRRLVGERARFARYGQPLSIAMIDVDKLKMINDQRGHLAGSHALRSIASVLRRQARTTDLVVRYGGDEFVALLPQTALSDAVLYGNRVLAEVAALKAEGIPVTVSIEAAALTRSRSLESGEGLLRRADRAAYRAKRAGGNCLRADEDEPTELAIGR